MTEQERRLILKAGLLLVLLEGWASPAVIRDRLGVDTSPALLWLCENGYADQDETGHHVRWNPTRSFEGLWSTPVPERGCPVTLCGKGATRGRGLRSCRTTEIMYDETKWRTHADG